MKNSRRNEGFTLIELLVVISIISLISSIVLASVRDARNKAIGSKFRQEVNQLVLAIELYRDDHGQNMPLNKMTADLDTWGHYVVSNTGSESSSPETNNTYTESELLPYINKIPRPPFEGQLTIFRHETVLTSNKCSNDSVNKNYVIVISGSENMKYFNDLGYWTTLGANKCISM